MIVTGRKHQRNQKALPTNDTIKLTLLRHNTLKKASYETFLFALCYVVSLSFISN